MPKKSALKKSSLTSRTGLNKTKGSKTSRASSRSKKISATKKVTVPRTRKVLKPKKSSAVALQLIKAKQNPILAPRKDYSWESQQTFNPAALYENGSVHLIYRAVGDNGLSVFGYAQSKDGVTISERSDNPVYLAHKLSDIERVDAFYSLLPYISGGGFGGAEDPRITRIGDRIYMLYVAFEDYPRLAMTSISLENFLNKKWKWRGAKIISKPGVIDKSGCLFPEKINGKYAILHRIFPHILIDFVDNLDFSREPYLKGEHKIPVRKTKWDSRKIGAGAPPIKTKDGWLLMYYAVDDKDSARYKIGAMILDLKDPRKVLYRTDAPILEPIEWYENEGNKSGIAYPCGAVIMGEDLLVYYGGADTVVCVARTNLNQFLEDLKAGKTPRLTRFKER